MKSDCNLDININISKDIYKNLPKRVIVGMLIYFLLIFTSFIDQYILKGIFNWYAFVEFIETNFCIFSMMKITVLMASAIIFLLDIHIVSHHFIYRGIISGMVGICISILLIGISTAGNAIFDSYLYHPFIIEFNILHIIITSTLFILFQTEWMQELSGWQNNKCNN